ncbi:MAG TPA: hypothetical protein VEW69_06830 [Alphaproteobacteria bacterium]|nr:hypothetical protein [Alphaproteobacteria bacterium]
MDTTKIIIFALAVVVLLLLGKIISLRQTRLEETMPPDPVRANLSGPDGRPKQPAAVGADLPFPISLPELAQSPDGRYNRPRVLNYYFSKIDLVAGPTSAQAFCDEFFIELQNPTTGYTWRWVYTIATPQGLQREMDNERSSSLYLESVIVVPRWDMAGILTAVMDDVMKNYDAPTADEGDEALSRLQDPHRA